jgi:hypothetical protein
MVNTLLQPAAMMRVQLVNLAVMKFMSLIKKEREENCTVSVSGGVAASRSAAGSDPLVALPLPLLN